MGECWANILASKSSLRSDIRNSKGGLGSTPLAFWASNSGHYLVHYLLKVLNRNGQNHMCVCCICYICFTYAVYLHIYICNQFQGNRFVVHPAHLCDIIGKHWMHLMGCQGIHPSSLPQGKVSQSTLCLPPTTTPALPFAHAAGCYPHLCCRKTAAAHTLTYANIRANAYVMLWNIRLGPSLVLTHALL